MEAMATHRCVQAMDAAKVVGGGAPVRTRVMAGESAFFGQAGVFERKQNVSLRSPQQQQHQRRGVVQAKIREIFMPALSSTMTEGKIVSWVKGEGDKLSKGESVVVVESDKADMDVETFYDGYLAVIVVDEGEVAPVGAAIGLLAETEDEIAEAKAKNAKSGGGAAAAAPPPPPAAAAAAPPPPPPAAAVTAPVTPVQTPAVAPVVVSSHPAATDGRVVATPYAKKLAKQFKLNLATVAGSGPLGRIVAADVEAAAGKTPTVTAPLQTPTTPVSAPAPAPASSNNVAAPSPAAAAVVPGTTVPFTAMQKGVARNMNESLNVPTFQVGYTINTDALDALYLKIKSKGVTMTSLLAKAVGLALAKHPVVNASCKDGQSFTYNTNVNVAVAVALDGGLLTPVLVDADKVDIYALSRKWKELVSKARSKTLTPAEFTTGTFALSNLGMFGVDRFTAILPPGMGAILAVGASKPTLVVSKDGSFSVKSQMQVNVTADHRIVYGGDLAEFLQTFAAIVEDPKDLLL